jgi:hypothetical protein
MTTKLKLDPEELRVEEFQVLPSLAADGGVFAFSADTEGTSCPARLCLPYSDPPLGC